VLLAFHSTPVQPTNATTKSHSLQMVRPTVAARKAMVQTPLQQDETLSAYDMAQYNDRLLQFVLLA